MSKNDRFSAKPDPGRYLLDFFTSRYSPEHVESKYILFKKPDSAPKIRILASGENPGHKKPYFLINLDEKCLKMMDFKGKTGSRTDFVWENFCIRRLPITCRFQIYTF